jgi:hypothetical protein
MEALSVPNTYLIKLVRRFSGGPDPIPKFLHSMSKFSRHTMLKNGILTQLVASLAEHLINTG